MSSSAAQPSHGLMLEGERLVVTTMPNPGFLDPRFMVAALLQHVARGDGEVVEDEARTMLQVVAKHFDLDCGRAQQKLSAALNLYSSNMDLAAVGEILCDVLDAGERVEVMLMLLRVVAADGHQRADELRAVDEVTAVLGISPEEQHSAFQRYFAEQEK